MAQESDSPPAKVIASAPPSGQEGGPSHGVANEAGLAALGEEMHRSGSGRSGWRKGRRVGRRHRVRNFSLIGLAVLLVAVGGGAGYAYYVTHDLKRVEVNGLSGTLTTGIEGGTENILMVGSTSRCALKQQNAAYGLCSQGVNGVNSDVIMILHADPSHHRLALLSIPRDLFIPNARSSGANKVDAGLSEGLTQVVAAVEEDFGIPIQHAVSLNFDQFANIVDSLGGINLSFPDSVFDAESGLNVQAAACVHLDGTQALQVVRARHLQYKSPSTTTMNAEYWPQENQSDLIAALFGATHEFLRVLAGAVAKQGLGNSRLRHRPDQLGEGRSQPSTNLGLVIATWRTLVPNSPIRSTSVLVPQSHAAGGRRHWIPPGPGGSYVYSRWRGHTVMWSSRPNHKIKPPLIRCSVSVTLSTRVTGQSRFLTPSTVSVSVMNGTGASNQEAADTGFRIDEALGFHVVGLGDTQPVGDVAETFVYYGSHRPPEHGGGGGVGRPFDDRIGRHGATSRAR